VETTDDDPAGARVVAIYRYPVKGMTAEPLASAELGRGETIAFDRAYAIENGPGRFDPENPRHLPKVNFLMLMRNEKLASLDASFNSEDHVLTIKRDGRQVARGAVNTKLGRQMVEQFLAAYLAEDLRGPPRIVAADGHSFSDVAQKCLHIINLESLRDLERVCGRPLDPLRFRPNVIIDGVPAWSEFKWIDQDISIGEAVLTGSCRTQRCAATNVDPSSAARDTAIPAVLERTWDHSDFGIYATVAKAGRISDGDLILVSA